MILLTGIRRLINRAGATRRLKILRRLTGMVASMTICLSMGSGCAAVRGRHYGHLLFPSVEHFRVQVIHPEGVDAWPLQIERLLLLPPVGDVPPVFRNLLLNEMRSELQQILPAIVRTPPLSGLYAPYLINDNLLTDNGGLAVDELVRIGHAADATHLMVVRVIEFRPYHPQRIFMEWTLLDIARERKQLVLVGGMDASEQSVLIAADVYLRQRKARPYTTANLDLLMRSPRDYCGFTVAQAVNALQTRLAPVNGWHVDSLKSSPRYGDNINNKKNNQEGDRHAYR